jgi:hypothetical protein
MWHFSGSPHMQKLQQYLRTSHSCIPVFLLALVVAASWDCIDNDTIKLARCTAPWCAMSVEHWWEDNWLNKTEVLTVGQEPVPVPVCPSQVLHKWHQVWTNVSHSEKSVATRQSSVVAVIRHKYQPKYNSINFYRTAQAHLFYICCRPADNNLCFCHSSMCEFMRDLASGTKFNCNVHDL